MSLFDAPQAIEVDDDVLEELALQQDSGQLLEIKPYKDSDRGMQDNIEMYKAFHERDDWHGINTSPTHSFEMWYDGENIRFFVYVGDEDDVNRIIRHITSNFPSARITIPKEDDVPNPAKLPDIEAGEYIAGARFDLSMHFYAPIRNPNGVEPFHGVYRNIASNMTSKHDVKEVIQVLFRPAGTGWTSSRFSSADEFAEQFSAVDDDESSDPGEVGQAAANIKSQLNQPGFYINVRILTIADTETRATTQRDDLARAMNNHYREWTGQQLVPNPQQGYEVQRLANEMASRQGRYMDWPQSPRHLLRRHQGKPCKTMIMTIPELAALAHIPNAEILDNAAVDWVVLDSSNRLPSKAPKYEDYKQPPEPDEQNTTMSSDTAADTSADAATADSATATAAATESATPQETTAPTDTTDADTPALDDTTDDPALESGDPADPDDADDDYRWPVGEDEDDSDGDTDAAGSDDTAP